MSKQRFSIADHLTFVVLVTVVMVALASNLAAQSNVERGKPSGQPASDGDILPGSQTAYLPHQLVVRLNNSTALPSRITDEFMVSVAASMTSAPVYLLNIDPAKDEQLAAEELTQSGVVAYAHPNYLLNETHPIQGSYPFSDVNFIGDYYQQLSAGQIHLAAAHQTATGAGVTVGIIDGGIDFTHATISSVCQSAYDFVEDDTDASDDPGGTASGHGTFVAGVIHLSAPEASIRAYRIMDEYGHGDGFTLAQAIERAVLDNCDVINLSVVLIARHLAVRDAIDFAASQGVTVVAGAGNSAMNEPIYPAAETNVIAVAALDSLYRAADFTSFGDFVDISAPGSKIYSTYQSPYYAWWSGTSFSAPFVSGVAALVRDAHSSYNWLQIRDALLSTARPIDSLNPMMTGLLGHGLISADMAVGGGTGGDTAAFIPDTIRFTHHQGALYLLMPSGGGVLFSTNAPSPYWSEVVGPAPIFTHVTDATGMSGDTVDLLFDPIDIVGTYYNTVLFHVDGVAEPAELTVCMTVIPADTVVTWPSVSPSIMNFSAVWGTDPNYVGTALLTSPNAPAAFHAVMFPDLPQFVRPIDTLGMTNGMVQVEVNPTLVPAPGRYVNRVAYHVDGLNDPAVLMVVLDVTGVSGGGSDTAWVDPPFTGPIVLEEGAFATHLVPIGVFSTNAQAPYFVETPHIPIFTYIPDSLGYTNDTLVCQVSAGNLPPGTYVDSLYFHVSGAANSPVLASIMLIVTPRGGGSGDDSAWIFQDTSGYGVEHGSGVVIDGRIWVRSTNAPAPYSVTLAGQPEFIVLTQSNGVADDIFNFRLDGSHLPAGTYVDTILFTVNGVVNNPVVAPVVLYVNPGSGGDGPYISPTHQMFTAPLDQNLIQPGAFFVGPEGDPLQFPIGITVSHLDQSDFTVIIDSVGIVGDSVHFSVVSTTGMGGGIFVDSLLVTFNPPYPNGVTNLITVNYLHVSDTGGGGSPSAAVHPPVIFFSDPTGTGGIQYQQVLLTSTNAPAQFTATVLGSTGSFVVLPQTSGTTNDSVTVGVDPTGLPFGNYIDTVFFSVQTSPLGYEFPAYLEVRFAVGDSTQGTLVHNLQNYPNPFNPSTIISFSLTRTSTVSLDVFNLLGQHVAALLDNSLPAGEHTVRWEGINTSGAPVPSGMYFYRLKAEGLSLTRKMVLIK